MNSEDNVMDPEDYGGYEMCMTPDLDPKYGLIEVVKLNLTLRVQKKYFGNHWFDLACDLLAFIRLTPSFTKRLLEWLFK